MKDTAGDPSHLFLNRVPLPRLSRAEGGFMPVSHAAGIARSQIDLKSKTESVGLEISLPSSKSPR